MNTYRITALHPTGQVKTFKFQAEDIPAANTKFRQSHPKMTIVVTELIQEDIPKSSGQSKAKRRGHYKARLCQIRANLQSMTDDEDGLLTQEEILQIQRIACKVDRVVALFPERTMELKCRGVL
jgi:FMN-dependent NADH-azoreductase